MEWNYGFCTLLLLSLNFLIFKHSYIILIFKVLMTRLNQKPVECWKCIRSHSNVLDVYLTQ